eukprot:TRINITY_DN80004_c0_g1_i1.p2 TRINITY_DN80004_c0_g1~~TRINITY_DN80004_c0_g1_i1.p2  ORF type:complete len:140 (-),score=18.30 TRINITY_DN80004_c0_g1_i1:79-498(-)
MTATKHTRVQIQRLRRLQRHLPPFDRHQSDTRIRVKPSWRKQRGIDSAMRRKYRGYPTMVEVGFGTQRKCRGYHPDGTKHMVVNNVNDLKLLTMQNFSFSATIGHAVSAQKRRQIVELANQLKINVTNAKARLRAEEAE